MKSKAVYWQEVMYAHLGDHYKEISEEVWDNTPERLAKMYDNLLSGYGQKPEDILKIFDEPKASELILESCEFYSLCEHHVLPFYGKVWIAYVPKKEVVGLSKLARLVDIYAHRLQLQERLTEEIAEALWKHLKPRGVMVIVEAKHLCMIMRGVEKQDSLTTTVSTRGCLRLPERRNEVYALVKKRREVKK